MPILAERSQPIQIKDVSKRVRFREVLRLTGENYKEKLQKTWGDVQFLLGTIAVHGLEPQQIAANVGLAINDELEENELTRKPVILPFIPGDAIYGERNISVLQSVYKDRANEIYLSEDLGRALKHTEFGTAGYQPHWNNVRKHYREVDHALQDLVNNEFQAIRLDTVLLDEDKQSIKTFNQADSETGKHARIVEINAGANSSAATTDGRVTSHSVFPVTLDGLVELVKHNQKDIGFQKDLVDDIGKIAKTLRGKFDTILLSDLHTLGKQRWF